MNQPAMIGGRYELGGRVGAGGMSTVHRARDSVLERTVAVKVLAEHLSDDEKFVARFRREALAVARLVHPNIVQVYDTGVDADRHFIVMEYVEGRSGAQILKASGALPSETAAAVAIQACAGLSYAHGQGIIHRDVKPGNLMIVGGPASDDDTTAEMTVKLTDFGIARAAEQTRLTLAGSVVGTAAYLAPEQARGEEATECTDIYALGVVTYQLLTGRLPYEGSNLSELATRRENEDALPPDAYSPDVPKPLSASVMRALENDPGSRYPDGGSFAEGLRQGLAGKAPAPRRRVDRTSQTRVLAPEESTPTRPDPPVRRRTASAAQPRRSRARSFGRALGFVILLVLLAAIVAGVVLLATDAGRSTDVGQILENSIDDQIQRLEQFIRDQS